MFASYSKDVLLRTIRQDQLNQYRKNVANELGSMLQALGARDVSNNCDSLPPVKSDGFVRAMSYTRIDFWVMDTPMTLLYSNNGNAVDVGIVCTSRIPQLITEHAAARGLFTPEQIMEHATRLVRSRNALLDSDKQ